MPGSSSRRRVVRGRTPPRGSDLEQLKNFWDRSYSSDMSGELADAFEAMFGNGYSSSGVGGIERHGESGQINEYGEFSGSGFNQGSPHGNEWLGPNSNVKDRFGDPIKFRRDVSPYMMYNYAEMPEMWDELPDPATPSRGEAGMSEAFMADPWREDYSKEYMADRMEDMLGIARKAKRRSGSGGAIGDILSRKQLMFDRINRMRSGR